MHEFVSEIVQQNSLRDDDEPITFDCHTKNCRIAMIGGASIIAGLSILAYCGWSCYARIHNIRNATQENQNINITSNIQLTELSPLLAIEQKTSMQ